MSKTLRNKAKITVTRDK